MSLTLQSDTEVQAALPSRRSALHGAGPRLSDSAEASDVPRSSAIDAGWYADPMGNAQSRWWDGTAWTAEMGLEAPAEPVVAAETVVAVPPFAVPVLGIPVADLPAFAPLSRRQLRELVGPLTTGPVEINASAEGAPTPAASDAASFIGTTNVPDDASEARLWIGATTPLMPAASAPSPVPVQLAPPVPAGFTTSFAVGSIAPTLSVGAIGFTLPPDPFATPSAALVTELKAARLAFAPSAAAWAVSQTLAVRARSTTAAVWLFTFLPVAHVALAWFVLVWLDLGGDPLVGYSVLGAPLFLYLVFAFADRRVLRSRGFERTAPVALALIPPIYLLVRAIRVGAAGIVPLLLWLLLQTAACSFLLFFFPAVFALVPLTSAANSAPVAVVSGPITDAQRAAELTPTGMAAELTRLTRAKNLSFSSISCPAIPATLDGTTVTCVGTIASVKMNLNVVIDSTLPNSAFALVGEAPAA